jgi:CRISPR-associated protein (TIGR03986 family)
VSNEQKGTLVGKVLGTDIGWELRWIFNGKPESRKQNQIYGAIPESIRRLRSSDFPAGLSLEVLFVFAVGKPANIRVVDEAFAAEANRREAEAELALAKRREAAENQRKDEETKQGVLFAQPSQWTTHAGPKHFHNPYNFVPTPGGAIGAANPLRHGKPVGHHAYHPAMYSGTIDFSLTVATPLILSDTSNSNRDDRQHLTVGPRKDASGNPLIPITSMKGVLRAAYEAITLSRMAILGNHDERLGRRMAASEGLAMVPARIAADGRSLELWMGTLNPTNQADWLNRCPQANRQPPGNLMYAAWLPFYTRGRTDIPNHRRRYPGNADPQHEDQVVCWLRKYSRRSFTYWRVEEIRLGSNSDVLSPRCPAAHNTPEHAEVPNSPTIKAIGYVCKTGQNFGTKHDERVFFVPVGQAAYVEPGSAGHFEKRAREWKRLIEDYVEVAKDNRRGRNGAADESFVNATDGRPAKPAFSRHIYVQSTVNLNHGSLCYALVTKTGQVNSLYPVMIARELGDYAPKELVPDNLGPARKINDLSPADRVFGWVNQDGAAKSNRNMVRGQLRIATLNYEKRAGQEPFSDFSSLDNNRGLALAILSTPKPQQARFYLAADKVGTPQANSKSADSTFYKGDTSEKSFRGRKVYPHHRHTAVESDFDYWNAPAAVANPSARLQRDGRIYYREFVRQGQGDVRRDDQNRSVTGWVNPGTLFTGRIEVTNLSAAELGALLWLLKLPDGHYLRMGFGKPLGFGSVQAKLTAVDLADGDAVRADYASIQKPGVGGVRYTKLDQLDSGPISEYKIAFSSAFAGDSSFDTNAVIRSFLASAAGFDDNLPLHYPRATPQSPAPPNVPPNAEGKNYEWFVENIAAANKRENRPEGPRLALPPLWAESGMPYLTHIPWGR